MASPQPTRWGIDAPATEAEARDRILQAAARCYLRHGVTRTTVEDIAREAMIHRTTVYAYFKNRDDVLASAALADSRPVIAASDRIMRGPGRFVDRLVDAFAAAQDGFGSAPLLALLYDPENAARTVGATSASLLLQQRHRDALAGYVALAQDSGELRTDLPAAAIAAWISRIHHMLLADPPGPDEGGAAGVLRQFVAASIIDPATSRDRT